MQFVRHERNGLRVRGSLFPEGSSFLTLFPHHFVCHSLQGFADYVDYRIKQEQKEDVGHENLEVCSVSAARVEQGYLR